MGLHIHNYQLHRRVLALTYHLPVPDGSPCYLFIQQLFQGGADYDMSHVYIKLHIYVYVEKAAAIMMVTE